MIDAGQRRLGRRQFLRCAGQAGAGIALASVPFLEACKGSTTPDEPGRPVTLNFTVYNHTQGLRGSFSKNDIQSGSSLTLKVADLIAQFGIQDVNATGISVRKENFGKLVRYSAGDSVSFSVPSADASYDIFLFNRSEAVTLYAWQDAKNARWNNWGMMYDRHPLAFYRKDFDLLTGEERVWGGDLLPETGDFGVFDQLNNALRPAWAAFRYGYFERRPSGTSGDSSYGFGTGYGHEFWKVSHDFVVVNPTRLTTIPEQVAGGMAAVIESLIGWENVADDVTYKPIQSNGVLNQAGLDYIAFLYVRDLYTSNILL